MSEIEKSGQDSAEAERLLPAAAASDLLSWYLRHRRDLPWRRTDDPYAIWVSEVMLQQTQVAKVEPYFEAFMARFPTLEALADAPLDDVLAAWSGLGYYRRARLLHRAARELAQRGEKVPRSAEELRQLPGIGAYTSAAIASIAFGEVVPVLDGNVERVACRLLALEGDPKKTAVRRRLVHELEGLLDQGRPGDSNQALMELGATVCRPRSPACPVCPLEAHCRGKKNPESYPPPRRRRATETVTMHLAVVERDARLLLFRRPRGAELFAGMWELPATSSTVETRGEVLEREEIERRLASSYGGTWCLEDPVAEVRHGITHRDITALVHPAEVEAGEKVAEGPEAAWVGEGEMGDYAVSSLVGKVLEKLGRRTDRSI